MRSSQIVEGRVAPAADPHTEIIFQRQLDRLSCLVSRNVAAQTDVLGRLALSDKLKVDVGHPRLGKLFRQCGDLVLVLARQYDFDAADRGRRYDFGSDHVSAHHSGTHSNHHRMKGSRMHHGYFASKLNSNDVVPFTTSVTSCTFSPRIGCQALMRCVPVGRSLIVKVPSSPVIA